NLWSRGPLFGSSLATDGPSGGAERDASVRADHRLYVRRDSEGLAAGKQRTARENGTCILKKLIGSLPTLTNAQGRLRPKRSRGRSRFESAMPFRFVRTAVTQHGVGPVSLCFREFDAGRWTPEKTERRFGFEHVRLDQLVLLAVPFGVAPLEKAQGAVPHRASAERHLHMVAAAFLRPANERGVSAKSSKNAADNVVQQAMGRILWSVQRPFQRADAGHRERQGIKGPTSSPGPMVGNTTRRDVDNSGTFCGHRLG